MAKQVAANQEMLLSLNQLSKVAAIRRSASQLRRWIRDGVSNRSGQRVFLEHKRIGRSIASTVESVNRFIDDLQR
jgi:hypothetical protein